MSPSPTNNVCVEHRVREERLSTAFLMKSKCTHAAHVRVRLRGHTFSLIYLLFCENYPLCVGHDINDLGIFPSRGTLGPSAGQEYGTECTSDAILTTGIYITTYNKISVFFLTRDVFQASGKKH